jgi:hypothetical protein
MKPPTGGGKMQKVLVVPFAYVLILAQFATDYYIKSEFEQEIFQLFWKFYPE